MAKFLLADSAEGSYVRDLKAGEIFVLISEDDTIISDPFMMTSTRQAIKLTDGTPWVFSEDTLTGVYTDITIICKE